MDALFDRDTRIITLRYGRANFTVVSDRDRPFVVKAAEGRIVADASNFDVRCDGQNASVMLFSGQASVNLNNEVRRLSPGERMALVGETVAAIDRPRAAAVGAWHSGRTVFEDTRLSEAVAEMNRYSLSASRSRAATSATNASAAFIAMATASPSPTQSPR